MSHLSIFYCQTELFLHRVSESTSNKRPKKSEGGLISGWKRRIATSTAELTISAATSSRTTTGSSQPAAPPKGKVKAAEDTNAVEVEDDGIGGEFAEDEATENVVADREAKSGAKAMEPGGKGRTTAQVRYSIF